MKGLTTEEIHDECCSATCQADDRKWIELKEAIAYFKGVQAQHIGATQAGMKNPNSEVIIKIYDFVIKKLQEWEDNTTNHYKK